MLIVGYCFGIRSERRLCEEVHLNLAYCWFCRLGSGACLSPALSIARGITKSGRDCVMRGPARDAPGVAADAPEHCWRGPGLAHRGGRATITAPSFPTRSTRCGAPT